MVNEETPTERDRRIRGEEARMVRFEEGIKRVETRVDSVHELLVDVRRRGTDDQEELAKHMHTDEERFSSIDSRLQGQQTQLTQINETVLDIKRFLTSEGGIDHRLRKVESTQSNWSAGWTALTAAAIVGAAISAIVIALVNLL